MLSRRLKNKIGCLIMVVSTVWLLGAAGADDLSTAQGISAPVLPLLFKALLGILGILCGAIIISRSERRVHHGKANR